MTINFVAILSHPFGNVNILPIPERLNANEEMRAAIAELQKLPYVKLDSETWHWEHLDEKWIETHPELLTSWWLTQDGQEGFIDLAGPDCRIDFGRLTCRLYGRRWQLFVGDIAYQLAMRRMCHAIAKIFYTSKALYVPDSNWEVSLANDCFYDGFTFEQIQDALLKTCGPPIESLKDTEALTSEKRIGGYYIDDFKDLETAPKAATEVL